MGGRVRRRTHGWKESEWGMGIGRRMEGERREREMEKGREGVKERKEGNVEEEKEDEIYGKDSRAGRGKRA